MNTSDNTEKYTILLFYKYVTIDDPEEFKLEQTALWHNLGITGRMLVASEGINGTLEGTSQTVNEYISVMSKDKRFSDVDWKSSEGDGYAFPKVKIQVKPEIVATHLGDDDVNPNETTGYHMSPEELKALYDNNEDFVIVDMRNDYEQEVGMFKNSVRSGMKNFRDLASTAEELKDLKDKKVVTVCTGGIRCEKASGYLLKKGFKDVSQLNGGMHRYIEKYNGGEFEGKLYVFDGRVTMDTGSEKVLGSCALCKKSADEFTDCVFAQCGNHFIACEECRDDEGLAFCSKKCEKKCVLLEESASNV